MPLAMAIPTAMRTRPPISSPRQRLQIRTLVIDQDDRHADDLGSRRSASGRRAAWRRLDSVNALMVFKSIRDSLSAAAPTWAFSTLARYVIQASDCLFVPN
jgi:hypothetical protein